MKKKISMLLLMVCCMITAHAEVSISVSNVSIPQGGKAAINIDLNNGSEVFNSFELELTLPEGVTYDSYAKGERLSSTHQVTYNAGKFNVISTKQDAISGESGTILTVYVKTDLAVTSEPLTATVGNVVLAQTGNSVGTEPADVSFSINVVEPSIAFTVEDVDVVQGSTGTITIGMTNDVDIAMFAFDLSLPSGITYQSCEGGERLTDGHSVDKTEGSMHFVCTTLSNATISGNSGTIMTITVKADPSLAVNTDLATATISNIEVTTPSTTTISAKQYNPTAVNFQLNIVEPTYTELNENTGAPTSETGAKVRVTRALTPNVWNTICLPIEMSEEQVKSAFGNDVQLGDFVKYIIEEAEVGEDIVGINVVFNSATKIEANHPYIIKVTREVDPFIIEDIDIVVVEDPCVEYDNGKTGSRREVLGTFMGNYVAGTEVPNKCLFLNDNKFYYSTGNTTMKAFRGYFQFEDILSSVNESLGNARMRIVFDGEATAIETVQAQDGETGVYYNLQGVAVENPGKGLYIKNGKKVIIK